MSNIEAVKETIEEIMAHLGIDPDVSINESEPDNYEIRIDGDDLSFLIGYRGESLEGLQTVLSLILFKKLNNWVRVMVDINDYKDAKLAKLEDITRNYIDKVRFLGKDMQLPPMNPFERRHVHMFVDGYDDVMSESDGEGLARRVVLKLIK
jgi:spoIIIJ-associated protein